MKRIEIFILLLFLQSVSFCSEKRVEPLLKFQDRDSTHSKLFASGTSSVLPLSIGLVSFIYLINPIILFENDKIAAGLTKEFSIGFGNFGEHRFSLEYSLIFRENNKHIIRAGYKYDILLKEGMEPSNLLQVTPVLSLGGGFYTNFDNNGFYPEVSYGYSFRNPKLLIYPHVKMRYTITGKENSNVFDFSFGIMVGLANPFIDLKIRKQ